MSDVTPKNTNHRQTASLGWFRIAIVKMCSGIILGVVTAVLLIVVSHVLFPVLADIDYDLGLEIETLAAMSLPMGAFPMKRETADANGYVFLDLDASEAAWSNPATNSAEEHPAPAAAAGQEASDGARHDPCNALARAFPKDYAVASPEAPGAPCTEAGCAGPRILDCSADRILNRYVLAELVKGLRAHDARLIVLDVELSPAVSVLSAAETRALRLALWRSDDGRKVPVLFAHPAEFSAEDQESGILTVRSFPVLSDDDSGHDAPAGASHTASAIAIPQPGEPLRRYPKCVRDEAADMTGVPSLPYAAAALLRNPNVRLDSLCPPLADTKESKPDDEDSAWSAPRIHYTFATLRAHDDETLSGPDFARWAYYRHVYNRCLASNFWSPDAHCGQREAYSGKVVVIGASNPTRRDQHYTPIGAMAGAEVVINATRSFALYSQERESTVPEALWHKLYMVMCCGFFWLAYFSLRNFLQSPGMEPVVKRHPWPFRVLRFVAFWLTLGAVLLLTVRISYASFSVLVGVLAVGLEQYVEVLRECVLKPFENSFSAILHVSLEESKRQAAPHDASPPEGESH